MTWRYYPPDVVAAWVTASCESQGLPLVVTAPDVVSMVSVLLTGRASPPVPQHGSAGPVGRTPSSEPPHGHHSGGLDSSGPGGAGPNHRVVEDRCHDLGLAG